MKSQAIRDLAELGWTRANIETVLGVSRADIQAVLGKGKAGKKAKEANPVEIPVIHDFVLLDRSSSMQGARINNSVIGVRQYIKDMADKQKEKGIESHFSLIEFADKVTCAIDSVDPSGKINVETGAMGNTALLDAIFDAICRAESIPEVKGKRNYVTITAFTDGEENCSKVDRLVLREKIKECKEKGWIIAFVGAGVKAIVEREAVTLGIDVSNVLSYDASDSQNFVNTMSKMSSSRSMTTDAIAVNKFSNVGYFNEDK